MNFEDLHPIYLQIANHVCEKILLKEWQAESKIPSVRELAVSVEVNPNTVMRAYTYLEEKSIIFKRRGIGYFVHKDAYANVLQMKRAIFLRDELPILFKNIFLLKINFKEIKSMYDEYKEKM